MISRRISTELVETLTQFASPLFRASPSGPALDMDKVEASVEGLK